MSAGIFLLYALAMVLAWRGRRNAALLLFAVALALSLALFRYHVTDPLNLSF